ncbi:MAG TPA: MFS transporter [Micromonosporaceae bacterium]|nr:MFS transporter [Micromonosporaceae bacterium]
MRDILRRPDFRLLFAGLVVSMTAESILLLALAIWVKDLTDSDGMAGATIFAVVAPYTLAPIVGWVVDRFRRRPFFIAANLLTAVVLTPLYAVRDRDDVWIIFAVAAGYGLSFIAISAALSGLIKEIVPADLLADANGALQTVKQGLRLIGPLLGAGLYAAIGGWTLATVGAVGFCVAAGVGALLRVRETKPSPGELHWTAEVTAGIRHLFSTPSLRRGMLGLGLAMLFIGFSESLIFAYVDRGLGRDPAFVGVLVAVMGVGGLTGGLISPAIVRRIGELAALAFGVALFVPAVLGLVYPQLWLGMGSMVIFGFGLPIAVVAISTLVQRGTPGPLMGRASTATDAVISIPQTLSIGTGAALVSLVDYRLMFVAMAAVMTVSAAYVWAGRRLTPPTSPAQPTPDAAPDSAPASV